MTASARTRARTIVIAWTETATVWDGEPFAADLGASPNMVERVDAKAVTWLLEGTQADVTRAKAHARTLCATARVFTFKVEHRDPHGAAKRKVLAA